MTLPAGAECFSLRQSTTSLSSKNRIPPPPRHPTAGGDLHFRGDFCRHRFGDPLVEIHDVILGRRPPTHEPGCPQASRHRLHRKAIALWYRSTPTPDRKSTRLKSSHL